MVDSGTESLTVADLAQTPGEGITTTPIPLGTPLPIVVPVAIPTATVK